MPDHLILDLNDVILIYRDKHGALYEQPLAEITSMSTPVNPETNDDLELMNARILLPEDMDLPLIMSTDNNAQIPRLLAEIGVLVDAADSRADELDQMITDTDDEAAQDAYSKQLREIENALIRVRERIAVLEKAQRFDQHAFFVTISGCNAEQAYQIISERLHHTEYHDFNCTITSSGIERPLLTFVSRGNPS